MISETQTPYTSRVDRHGRVRALAVHQSSTAATPGSDTVRGAATLIATIVSRRAGRTGERPQAGDGAIDARAAATPVRGNRRDLMPGSARR